MNRTYKYTILTLILAFLSAFGSMAVMNFILQERERQILTERGRVAVEAPVRSWQEQEEEPGKESDNAGYTLTTGQIEEVISRWDERTVVSHGPVAGQISMEEAIKAGEEWLDKMGMNGNGQQKDAKDYSVSATLETSMPKETAGVQLEPYYSFWYVQFSSQSMMAFLYVNAVTGKIWNADITLYEDIPEKMPYEKLHQFAELAGLQTVDTLIVSLGGTQAFLPIDGGQLNAEMEFKRIQKRYSFNVYSEEGKTEVNKGVQSKESAIIIFKLTVGTVIK